MRGVYALMMIGAVGLAAHGQQPANEKQLYEVRRYVLGEGADGAALDRYLGDILLPALERAGAGPVGLFAPAEDAESQDRFAILTYDRIEQVPQVHQKLSEDAEFASAIEALEAGGGKNLPYERIRSELLLAMDAMPAAKSGSGDDAPEDRVYELRIYESATERLGDRKVEMFNSGEVPIFLDSGINPVFLGQAIVGTHTPSLTYLTVYPDEAARQEAWKTFVAHPDWKKLSGERRYAGTVSKIYKFVLRALPQSQM